MTSGIYTPSENDVTAQRQALSPIGFADVVKHTPTPWALDTREFSDWGWIVGPDGLLVTSTCVGARYTEEEGNEARRNKTTPPTVAANADLIIKAVNSHDALINTLASLVAHLERQPYRDSAGLRPNASPQFERAKALVSSLQREALAEAPSSAEGVDNKDRAP
jgi:hypothetical protein